MNKDILDDYKWIRPMDPVFGVQMYFHLSTRIKYGVESDAKDGSLKSTAKKMIF